MKLKVIVIIVIIFSLLFNQFCVVYAIPPKCLTGADTYGSVPNRPTDVDWWVLIELYRNSAIYTDSNLKIVGNIINELKDYDVKSRQNTINGSSLYNTYLQAGNTNYNSIFYNDQNGKSNSGKYAHSKGFFIWNEEGGVHVIHSYPRTPEDSTKSSDFIKMNGKFSQHSICKQLSVDDLSMIPKFIIYADVKIQAINSLTTLRKPMPLSSIPCLKGGRVNCSKLNATIIKELVEITTFHDMDSRIEQYITNKSNNAWPEILEIRIMQEIAEAVRENKLSSNPNYAKEHYNMIHSLNNDTFNYFIQTSDITFLISKKEDIEEILKVSRYLILWSYIENYYDKIEQWISQTFSMHSNDRLPPNDKIRYVANYEYPFGSKDSTRSCDYNDHTKLFYGSSEDGKHKIFCFGDSNWAKQQQSRGGGALCTDQLGYLVDYMVRHVGVIADNNSYNVNRTIFEKYLPFTSAGSSIAFNQVSDHITNQKIVRTLDYAIELVNENTAYPLGFKVFKDSEIGLDYTQKFIPFFVSNNDPQFPVTELFSLYIFANINEKVLFCSNYELCTDYKDTYKFKLIDSVYATGEFSQRVSAVKGTSIKASPNLIKNLELDKNVTYQAITDDFKSMVLFAQFTFRIAEKFAIKEMIMLSRSNNTKPIFTFPITQDQINSICYNNVEKNKYLISFSLECYDNLAYCLDWAKFDKITISNITDIVSIPGKVCSIDNAKRKSISTQDGPLKKRQKNDS